jgi:uncharacterized protein (DUF1330 family)
MSKGYWIARLTVRDQAGYDRYRSQNGVAFKKYGARFLVRGGDFEAAEGEARPRNVVIEFPNLKAAHDCFHSPEYQRAKAERAGAADVDLVIIEGYDGPQP